MKLGIIKENENEERVVVQTASVVPLDENLVRKRVPPINQQGQFAAINHPRAPHLRPHPPNRPPPHHPQTQPRRGPVRIKPRRPGPPKRYVTENIQSQYILLQNIIQCCIKTIL